jgi:signal transduction histidine kinase
MFSKKAMKKQNEIALVFFLVAVTTVVLLSAGVYFFIIRYSFSDFYKRLEIRGFVSARANLDHEEASASLMKEVRDMHLERLPEEKEYYIKITGNTDFESEAGKLGLPASFLKGVVNTGSASYQDNDIFFHGIKYEGKGGSYVVIISAYNYYNSHHLRYLRNIFLIGVAIASILSIAIAFRLSGQVFQPVKEIANRVEEISTQSLHLRLEQNSKDEIGALEKTFNRMLDRLETSFATQNNFISNASHELSTPLTTIIGEAEVSLAKDRRSDEYKESLRSILGQAERLDKITKSLLFLAQTGFKGKSIQSETIRADELLWDVKSTIEKINSRNKIQLNLSLLPENPDKLYMAGNEQLLHLAISNIVNNACKYSDYQPVSVSIGTSEQNIVIVVKDTGIGIPEDELKYIYDPFFRASNTKNYEGYGIGLPLTANIVRLHYGNIKVSSRVGEGTTVQLTFPGVLRTF